ncbi:MAG: T9SS type A sorting domain-containing protein [Chitinophagales bacterium]
MKKLILLSTMVLIQMTIYAQKTYVYFQNSTSLDFSVSSTQTGTHTMESSEWWSSTTTINAWQNETNVLWTNRDAGIHWGDDFYLTTTLTSGSTSIDLKLKLQGDFIGSTIWCAAAGPGFSHGWSSDNNFHSQIFSISGKQYEIKYTFYFTGGYDDILYTIHEFDAFSANAAELNDPNIMNVLAYNTYMLSVPIALSDQGTRAQHIDEAVHDLDAILIQEVFDNSARATLLAQLAPEYPYQTDVVDLPNIYEDGGVMIVSRWPIEYTAQMVFNNCLDADCLSNKGVMYARINKLGKKYHLFSTHQNAQQVAGDAAFVNVRNLQMQQFNAFIDAQNIPVDEAVIFGGDMNVDKHANFLNEYNNMFTIFNATEPTYIGHPNTWDKYANHYVDLGSVAPEYLDYVLADNDYLVPDEQSNSVWVLRSNHDDMWNIHDLSDHFGVLGRFVYTYPVNACDTTTISIASNVSDETAPNANDGSIDITVSGGTAAYSYSWSNGSTTEDISGLAPGNYSVTVTDANGCIENTSVNVAAGVDPCATTTISISSTTIDESGVGANDGSIDITVSGGAAAYSYNWSNGSTTEDISGLTAGVYDVTVTDANGCLETASVTISTVPSCNPATTNFSSSTLTHSGNGSSSVTASFDAGSQDVSFNILEIDQKLGGKTNRRYIELVTVTYVDGAGNTQTYGSFSGANMATANVSIAGVVQSISIQLEDVYSGNTNSTMTISLSSIDYCGAPACADADNDGVCDIDDVCPGFDDTLIGTACNDGDDCTENDVYTSNCNCVGTYTDSDSDGVCDANDVCPGGDDLVDANNNGIPDFCDSGNCTTVTNPFNNNPLTHSGNGSNSTTLNLPNGSIDVEFIVSNIGAVLSGKGNKRYIESVTITYVDGGGNTQPYGTFENAGTVNVTIAGAVQSVTVSLSDAYDGNSSQLMSVNLSDVTSCSTPSSRVAKVDALEKEISIYPNPASSTLFIKYSHVEEGIAIVNIYALNGQQVYSKSIDLQENMQIDVSDLEGGIYVIQITNENGDMQALKFVKQ